MEMNKILGYCDVPCRLSPNEALRYTFRIPKLMLTNLCDLLLTKTHPETARRLCVKYLDAYTTFGWHRSATHIPAEDPVELMGLRFPNRVGIAAGFDRNGEIVSALGVMGAGHVEIGTVTPVAQPGNAAPRVQKITATQAIVNRIGFRNHGCEHVLRNLKSADAFILRGGILGINIAKNATTPIENAVSDFRIALNKMYAKADYLTINISSPNTRRLGELQFGLALNELLDELNRERTRITETTGEKHKPLVIKLSADLTTDDLYRALESIVANHMDGVIVSNTSSELAAQIHTPQAFTSGGLSGAPLMARSTKLVCDSVQYLQGAIPVIASGGIMTPEDAVCKIQAGASLVQLHSALYYQGFGLIADCVDAVAQHCISN